MKNCPFCDFANYDEATQCRKCEASFESHLPATIYKAHLVAPQTARDLRGKALSFVVLGLLIHVYWGGYGPWPVVDSPTLSSLRAWLEPLFLYGGALAYIAGWVLAWV